MRLILSCLTALLFLAANAQSDDTGAKFKATTHSFGKVKQHVPVTTEFTFTNTSGKNLIIEAATAECGCTTPDYPKIPIEKGKDATIKVTYNAESPGKFTKKVTVKFANVKEPVILTIEGEVVTGS
jgi:hypothetical protein